MIYKFKIDKYIFDVSDYSALVYVSKINQYGVHFYDAFSLQPSISIEDDNGIERKSYHRFPDWERSAIIDVISSNLGKFTVEHLDMYFQMPDHYVLLENDHNLYKTIKYNYNGAFHFRHAACLTWLITKKSWSELNREFVLDALTSQVPEEYVNDYIEEFLYDYSIYDWPVGDKRTPEERRQDYLDSYSQRQYFEETIKIFQIPTLPDIYYIECYTKKRKRIMKPLRKYIVRDGDLYRPFDIPNHFIGEGQFIYILP